MHNIIRLTKRTGTFDLEREVRSTLNIFKQRGIAPFTDSDTSVGMEHELQVAVEGSQEHIDLPIIIGNSRFYRNTIKHASRGDLSPKVVEELNNFLHKNTENIWENSWVYFSEGNLVRRSREVLAHDFLSDKGNPESKNRADIQTFYCTRKNKEYLRLPISYLLKLALIDSTYRGHNSLPLMRTAEKLATHFTSDNTSPEILSFTLQQSKNGRLGVAAAQESARVFLTTQLLAQYANQQFGLIENGQKCLVYNAPHAPIRQKKLNGLVPEGFYRHLFMSPCLSGWDKGEDKHRYMALCHRTLSGSQLNTINKLKDAGIIKNNLTILPNTSNTCLANNGTHISVGSAILGQLAAEKNSIFTAATEKYLGDLVIKVVEHFLPLLVNTYTASPYRVNFSDCHPENILGFLPHELDYTHLRMIWRRWKKKAKLRFMGNEFTPFGPKYIDNSLATLFRLQGDIIPDFRLIDYLVTLRSTETSPALNGQLGNDTLLKEELSEQGIFDSNMSIYLPYRMRAYDRMGYSGFEGRSYSLFHSFMKDMAEVVNMQNCITALAYQYVISGKVCHQDIPDKPSIESERRQIFFATALGVPTFYVKSNSGNRFLKTILTRVKSQRNSRRYKGYIRIQIKEYQQALIETLTCDGSGIIDTLGMREDIYSLRERLDQKGKSTLEKLTNDSCQLSKYRSPMSVSADHFNQSTERYYRTELRRKQTEEGLNVLQESCRAQEKIGNFHLKEVMSSIKSEQSAADFVELHREDVLTETCSIPTLQTLLAINLAIIHHQQNEQNQ